MMEHTHWHTLALLGCFDRSRTDVWFFFALDEIEIEGWSEKETGGLSRNTVLLFLLRDARETSLCCNPPLPTHRKSTQSGTVHFVLVSPGWTVPFDSMRCKEGRVGKRAVTKKHKGGEKLGGIADSTLRGWRKDIFLLKINVSCLSGALQQKGKKEKSLFSIIIQTCSTKTTNHIHKPLIGTVYLSENIIEPKNKKAVLFLKMSLDNKQVRHLKVSC